MTMSSDEWTEAFLEARAWQEKALQDFKNYGDVPICFYALLRCAEQWSLMREAKHAIDK